MTTLSATKNSIGPLSGISRIGTKVFDDLYLFNCFKGMTLFALRCRGGDGDQPGAVHLPIREAIEEIRCAFGTERSDAFSETLWPDCQQLQKSLDDRRHGGQPGVTSPIYRARAALHSSTASNMAATFSTGVSARR